MSTTYAEFIPNKRGGVQAVALALVQARPKPCRLAPFVVMTDPERGDDPLELAQSLPQGSALIYRHFGAPNRIGIAHDLRRITQEVKAQFLIGNDPDLAVKTGADGVHFRRHPSLAAPRLWRDQKPDWLITMAGIKAGDYTAPLDVLDGLLVSSIFPSQSRTAGEPIGIAGLKRAIARYNATSVFALGGVNDDTATALIGSGAAGLAGVSFKPN